MTKQVKIAIGAGAAIAGLVVVFWPRTAAAAGPVLTWKNDGPPTIKPRNQSLTYKGAGNMLTGKTYDEIMNGSATTYVNGEPQLDLVDPNLTPIY